MNFIDLNNYQAVVFDLFHTLTSLESSAAPGRSTSEILGVDRKVWNEQQFRHADDLLRGREPDPYESIKKMARAIKPDIPEELIRQATENRVNKFRYALEHPLLEAVEILARLKGAGKSTGLISNVFPMDICGWAGSPLKPFFDTVVFSCDVGLVKPEPEIYDLCLESLGVKPERALFVGDGGSDELEGARRAGLTPVLVTGIRSMLWPETLEAIRKHADYEIEKLYELFGSEAKEEI